MLGWGANGFGQLGNGSTTGSDLPVDAMVPPGAHVQAIGAGCDDSYARTTGGQVLAWGYNGDGELGNGTTTSSDTPVTVGLPAGLGAIGIGSGPVAFHSFAIVRKLPQ